MGVYEAIKDALKLAQASDNAPLIRGLTEALVASAELSSENIQLKDRVRELDSRLKFKESIALRHQVLWSEGDSTPYCRVCWENAEKALHLDNNLPYESKNLWGCPVCKGRWFVPPDQH